MSESSNDADKALDPKEQMKAALEAKKNAHHASAQGASGGKNAGGPHGQQGGKRTFRRKAGG